MSKIYEALEKHHGEALSTETLSDEIDSTGPSSNVRFHEPGINVAGDNQGRPIDATIESINLNSGDADAQARPESRETPSEEDRYFAGHLYSISLDDIRSVSAAIRSTVRVTRSRSIGMIGLGAGQTGSALIRDLAAYESTLDVNGVLLVDADRVRRSQSQFYTVSRDRSFDAARLTDDWRAAVEPDVTRGVDLICFSGQRLETHPPIEQQTYKSFLTFCRSGYELSLFDLPADGPGSEMYNFGVLLDAVIVVCPANTDATVVNRYTNDLQQAGLRVFGAVTIA